MANLAIKGHPKRGNEVIERLEMLGGKSNSNMKGYNDDLYYFIAKDGLIYGSGIEYVELNCKYTIFTIEEFLEKYPYKIGDKVKAWINGYHSICNIQNIQWDSIANEIKYKIQDYWHSAMNLQPYKEETMEEDKKAKGYCTEESEDSGKTKKIAWFTFWDNDFADEVELYLKDRELVQKDGKWFVVKKNSSQVNMKELERKLDEALEKETTGAIVDRFICLEGYDFYDDKDNIIDTKEIIMKRKKLKYPKTYKECCEILGLNTLENDASGYKHELIIRFQELLIARDAYWKIAGEQMGLGKSWEPDFGNDLLKYYISFHNNKIDKGVINYSNKILAFPTEEMRDDFYNNFKDLIENCKELL